MPLPSPTSCYGPRKRSFPLTAAIAEADLETGRPDRKRRLRADLHRPRTLWRALGLKDPDGPSPEIPSLPPREIPVIAPICWRSCRASRRSRPASTRLPARNASTISNNRHGLGSRQRLSKRIWPRFTQAEGRGNLDRHLPPTPSTEKSPTSRPLSDASTRTLQGPHRHAKPQKEN